MAVERPETLIEHLMTSPSAADKELILRAYEYAKSVHSTQKRFSGEPYFTHVFETALILADLGMDAQTVAAGLLHDVLEDAEVDEEVFKKEFGESIYFLVSGVTKLGKIRFRGAKRHIESLRKLFVATSQDIRILIIKLADRLHNMRTLEHVPEEKRLRIASETMEVYAPIAHRLGIGRIVGELEDLAFAYINPKEYKETERLLKEKHRENIRSLEKIYKKLAAELAKEKIFHVHTDYRRKHLYSLWKKLQKKDMDIDQIYDISALRVIVESIADCYRVLGVVHSLWRPMPGRIKDYIAIPKPNGYQSIHTTIFTGDGGFAEIQIRTEKMHRESEYGIASHVAYKEQPSGGKKKRSSNLDWFRQFFPQTGNANTVKRTGGTVPQWVKDLADAQKDISAPREFMENLRSDFFENRIFVFTPRGDVLDLPSKSTPVDFAYYIHSDIGTHMAGAKVNGKLASLGTSLENGDIVEIITKKASHPTQKWLAYARTTLAKRRIRSYLHEGKTQEKR